MGIISKYTTGYLLLFISLVAYLILGYYTARTNIVQEFTLFGVLFIAFFALVKGNHLSLKTLLVAGIVFRFLFLFSFPELSNDLYRFVWDGRLWLSGENPFFYLPTELINSDHLPNSLNQELYDNLNSQEYFTVYPPVCQAIFAFACYLSPNSIYGSGVVMKAFLFAAEMGSIYLLFQLAKRFSISTRNILWYALNPLVIFELCGNLHFEALMIFFLLACVYFISSERWLIAAVCMALSITTKLIPLMFLPFFIRRLGWSKSFRFFAITGAICILLFLPFLSKELILHFANSLDLYFGKFEFNAGIYYLVREIGEIISGFNLIRFIGPILSLIALGFIIRAAVKEKKPDWSTLPLVMLLAQSSYYFLATTVHPWYITTLIATCTLTSFRYPIVWSGAVLLSYYTYRTDAYEESMLLVVIEYVLVLGWFAWEWRNREKTIFVSNQQGLL